MSDNYTLLIHDNYSDYEDLHDIKLSNLELSVDSKNDYELEYIFTSNLDQAEDYIEEKNVDVFITGTTGSWSGSKTEEPGIELIQRLYHEELSNGRRDTVYAVLTQLEPKKLEHEIGELTGINSYRIKNDVLSSDEQYNQWMNKLLTESDLLSCENKSLKPECIQKMEELNQSYSSEAEKATVWHGIS